MRLEQKVAEPNRLVGTMVVTDLTNCLVERYIAYSSKNGLIHKEVVVGRVVSRKNRLRIARP